MAPKLTQQRISTSQKRGLIWKSALIGMLAIVSVYLLYPTVKYYTLTSAERQAMDPTALINLRDKSLNLGLDLQGGIHLIMQVDTANMNQADADDAVNRAMTVITNRVDQFGLAEPLVQRQGTNRIVVELPGMEDVERAKNLIGRTAQLEFKLLKRDEEIRFVMDRIDMFLASGRTVSDSTAAADTTGGLFDQPAAADAKTKPFTSLFQYQTFGDGVPSFDILVNPDNVPRATVFLNNPGVQKILSDNRAMILWGPEDNFRPDGMREIFVVNAANEMTGEKVKDARVVMGSGIDAGRPEITLENTADGVRDWARISGANIGRRLGIVLDGVVHSSPRFINRIYGGTSSITGSFTQEEARDLAIVLRAGALPASVEIMEDRTVGPSLGADSIENSKNALIAGLVMVVIFMVIWYALAGVVSIFALVLNILIILAYMAYFRATLTFPGIAGIILTIGMAVDGNVLIYERIREELRAGTAVGMAIANGFKRATWTILDSNITTILTGIILYNFGTGPIRGFALTLIVGLLASMFTALVVSRVIFDVMHAKLNITANSFGILKVFTKANFQFIRNRRMAYLLSAAVILAGLVSLGIKGGPKYSIDFKGGTLLEVHFSQPVQIDDIRSALGRVDVPGTDLATSEIKYIGANEQDVLIRIVKVENMQETSGRVKDVLTTQFADRLPENRSDWLLREEQVGPSIGNELQGKAIWAAFWSIIMLIGYLSVRFDFKFSLGAILAVVHDVLVTIGLFSIMNKEISMTIVAALLTIVGFSLNDTIVIFDRIRERFHRGVKGDYLDNLNIAVNETLSRTFITNFTVFLTVLALFFFGGVVIHDFALAMLIGSITGTYSTIFIATPLLAEWHLRITQKRAAEKKTAKVKVAAE